MFARIRRANLALTATLGLAITLTLSCGNHTFEELLGLESSSSELSSSSQRQSSSSRLGSSSQQQSSSSLLSSSSFKPSSSSSLPSSSSSVEYIGGSCNIKDYGTVQIGSQTWMAKNWGCYVTGSKCYNNDPANCEIYGRLYNWNTAMATCPSGWHIPSDDDWKELLTAVGGKETAGIKLRATSGWRAGYGADNYGFAALPGGRYRSGTLFSALGHYGYWWSATENSSNAANNWYIGEEEYVSKSGDNKDYLYSVRCIKDYSNSSSSSVAPPPSSSSSVPTQTGVIYGPSVTYEGETYKTVKIGTQTWFQRNLNYAVAGSKCRDGGRLIDANTKTCDTYGRLYKWATAMALDASCDRSSCSGQIKAKHKGICPSGWHIPSNDDWNELLTAVGGFSIAGSKLKATSGWYYWYSERSCNGTDDYGFTALPGGSGSLGVIDLDYDEDEHLSLGSWWSATEYDAIEAYRHYMDNGDDVSRRSVSKYSSVSSVRCVKD